MPYDAGNPVRVRATITDVDTGDFIDPATVAWTVYDPNDVATTPTGSHDGLGKFSMVFTPNLAGDWTAVATGTDPVFVAQREIVVNPVPLR